MHTKCIYCINSFLHTFHSLHFDLNPYYSRFKLRARILLKLRHSFEEHEISITSIKYNLFSFKIA